MRIIEQLREQCTKTYGAFLKARDTMPEWKAYEKARDDLDKEQARLNNLTDSTIVASGFKEDHHAHT